MFPGEPDRSAASFRDPAGYVILDRGLVKRVVTVHGEGDYCQFMSSGLYDRLVKDSLLIAHQEETAADQPFPEVAVVLVPEQIRIISYPYEWCFGQLRDAALLTLKVHEYALKYGMSLKDASAFNVQFRGTEPIFIDTLSFERNKGGPWPAYSQFCRHFLAPMALMSYIGLNFNQFWKSSLDGFPLDFVSDLLPRRSYFRFGLLIHIHLHANSQRKYSSLTSARPLTPISNISGPDRKQPLVESLRAAVQGLQASNKQTEWVDYYKQTSHYGVESEKHKKEIVSHMIEKVRPRLVYDLGGNTGEYSRVATSRGADCVCFDMDPRAVQFNYERCKATHDRHLLPLLMDLTNPTPPLGFHLRERLSLLERPRADLLLVLALIHHLRITGNVTFKRIAAFLADLGDHLILEYVPKEDLMVQGLLSNRKDTFLDYGEDSFLHSFQPYFEMEKFAPIPGTNRKIYLFRRQPNASH